jgi:hypothetical protein
MHGNNQPNAFELTAEQLAPFWATEKAASEDVASVERLLTAAFNNATLMASSVSGRTRTGRCPKLNEERLDYLRTLYSQRLEGEANSDDRYRLFNRFVAVCIAL